MVPATDNDLASFPPIFLTADSPWNPTVANEEFFFDSSLHIVDNSDVQGHRDTVIPA